MFINIQLSQCADINLEFTFCRKCIAQFIIQTMNSLYNQHILRTKLEKIAFILSVSCLKIKHWQFNTFSTQKSKHIFVELLYINCFKTFIIFFSIFIQRSLFSVLEIIINSDRMRLHSVRQKLNRQTMRKRSLSR